MLKAYFTTLVSLPTETTCRKPVLQLNTNELQRIRNVVHDTQSLLVVDESTQSGIQYLNILVGILKIPHVSYIYNCQPLPGAP